MNFNNLNGYFVEDTVARTAIGSIDDNGKITDNDFKTKFGDNSNLVQAVTSCAKLDNNGKIPADLLTVDVMQYKGKWDASGGLEPPVPENGRSTGDFYIISKSGTIDGNTVGINDRIIYNGNGWDIIKTAVMSAEMLDMIYPVGCLYWSSNNTNPGNLFGGTWTRIKDTFIYAASDNDTVNAATSNSTITGGSKTVTLTKSNIPSHDHYFTAEGTIPRHRHKMIHYHDRGTMEITAWYQNRRLTGGYGGACGGAFSMSDGDQENDSFGRSANDYKRDRVDFTASRTWSGATSGPLETQSAGSSSKNYTDYDTTNSTVSITGTRKKQKLKEVELLLILCHLILLSIVGKEQHKLS